MKKLFSVLLIIIVLSLSACTDGKIDIPGDKNDPQVIINDPKTVDPRDPNRILVDDNILCDYGVELNGECLNLNDILSDNINVSADGTIVTYNNNGVELMNDYIADVAGSAGLAVMPREVFEDNIDLSGSEAIEFLNLAATEDLDQNTENIIVSLTAEGVFEELGFTDEYGNTVEILSNPLALEVYGAFTVVIFEVNASNYGDGYSPDFQQRVYDSLYAGGIYLIHNESGKLFATKEIIPKENSWTNQYNFSRNVNLMVTLNEPVMETWYLPLTDENGAYMLDEWNNLIFGDQTVPVLDENGDPLVYTEGPYAIETVEVPITETYQVEVLVEQQYPVMLEQMTEVLDENGDPVLDELGNPKYDIEIIPALDDDGNQIYNVELVPSFDENGNPIFELETVALLDQDGNPIVEYVEQVQLDENGNPVYQQQFEVQLYIQDDREITFTEYYSEIGDGPLTGLAQKFVQKIMEDYYQWSYWRPSLYSLSNNTFAVIDSDIFYMEQQPKADNDSVLEQIVTKLSFDAVNEEITIEPYFNATKANFDECEIVLDPSNGNIICNPWEGNIKIYAPIPGPGLVTIPDSDGLQSVTFPNGELYFFDQQYNHEYIEELGYSTTALYTISDIGELETHYIELGSSLSLCNGYEGQNGYVDYCFDYIQTGDYNGTYIEISEGDARISSATLQLQSIGEFSSDRETCTNEECYMQVQYEIVDLDGNVVASFDNHVRVNQGQTANYGETYQIDPTANIVYERQQGTTPKYCDEIALGVGCNDEFYLRDYEVNENGGWVNLNKITADGDPLIDRMEINETNSVVYEYSRTVSGFLCEYTSCEEIVRIVITDADGVVIKDESNWMYFEQDEMVPIRVEYTITDDTVVTYTDDVCTTSSGCWRSYNVDGTWFSLQYNQGDEMYDTFEFAETDIVSVTEEVQTNEVCLDIDGCGYQYTEYIISDGLTELYTANQYYNYDYGTQIPFRVLIDISDTTSENEYVWSEEDRVCDDVDGCSNYVQFYKIDDTKTYGEQDYYIEHLGSEYYQYAQDEKMISTIGIPDDTVPTVIDTAICKNVDGCQWNTSNYIIVDADGKEYQMTSEDWGNYWLSVDFAYGDPIPTNEDFQVTFLMTDIEYYVERINVYDFMWALNSTIILDDNLYLIERQSWQQGDDNFILSFNEDTGRYAVKYTNISAVIEITKFNDSFIAINNDETAILNFSYNELTSDENYYYFEVVNLTDGLAINAVKDLIVDFDGSIYFSGVDNYVQDITGRINEFGDVVIDTDYTPVEIIRVRPIN